MKSEMYILSFNAKTHKFTKSVFTHTKIGLENITNLGLLLRNNNSSFFLNRSFGSQIGHDINCAQFYVKGRTVNVEFPFNPNVTGAAIVNRVFINELFYNHNLWLLRQKFYLIPVFIVKFVPSL